MTDRSSERAPSPATAAALSALLPGLGHFLLGDRRSGLAMMTCSGGLLLGLALTLFGPEIVRSPLSALLLAVAAPFLWIPVILDARRRARGSPERAPADRIWYVLVALATVGPLALPVLWRSRRFTGGVKWLLTILVVGLALGAVVFTLWVGPELEDVLRRGPI